MTELVTQTEAAKRLGVTQPAISKLVTSGKLPTVNGKIAIEMAGAILAQRLDPAQSKILRNLRGATETSPGDDQHTEGQGGHVFAYSEAKARREHHEASLAEMRALKLASELVDRSAVEASAFRIGRMTRDAVLGVPAKVASDLSNASDAWDLQQRLTSALRQALDDVARMSESDLDRDIAS